MTLRADNRLADVPVVPVACQTCGAEVLARKNSWEQTSVQWDADAMARCPQRRNAALLDTPGRPTLFLSCSELTESIHDAVAARRLPIVDETVRAAP